MYWTLLSSLSGLIGALLLTLPAASVFRAASEAVRLLRVAKVPQLAAIRGALEQEAARLMQLRDSWSKYNAALALSGAVFTIASYILSLIPTLDVFSGPWLVMPSSAH